jgi:hypothetical protein
MIGGPCPSGSCSNEGPRGSRTSRLRGEFDKAGLIAGGARSTQRTLAGEGNSSLPRDVGSVNSLRPPQNGSLPQGRLALSKSAPPGDRLLDIERAYEPEPPPRSNQRIADAYRQRKKPFWDVQTSSILAPPPSRRRRDIGRTINVSATVGPALAISYGVHRRLPLRVVRMAGHLWHRRKG